MPNAVYTKNARDLNCFTLNSPPETVIGGSRRRIVYGQSIRLHTHTSGMSYTNQNRDPHGKNQN